MGQKKNSAGRAQAANKKGNGGREASQSPPSNNKQAKSVPSNCELNTPCRQIAQLELKPKLKQSKLLSSKSLSQLMPRSLFFKKQKPTQGEPSAKVARLQTTKSFPTGALLDRQPFQTATSQAPAMQSTMLRTPVLLNRLNSASLIGLGRQSSGNLSLASGHTTLGQPNLSPIAAEEPDRYHEELSWTGGENSAGSRESACSREKAAGEKGEGARYRPLRSTKLALRDVKNSIGLRMRAKQDRQAFAKLTNDETAGATPPTKLYSPFNIYTPNKSANSSPTRLRSAGRRAASPGEPDTPKQRVAAQHRRHLIQTNRFTFDSPAGRLRETVREVEQFQQCIEDISKAIRARDRAG